MPATQSNVITGPDETPHVISIAGHSFSTQSYDQIAPCVNMAIPDGSGGRQLDNIPCGSLYIRNFSGNLPMFIGGVGQYAVFSGRGMRLWGGEAVTLPVVNANRVSVMASISGEAIECMAFLMGQNVDMDVSGIYIAPDETPPTVLTVSPASGASGVSILSNVMVTFSEPINTSTVDVNSFVVSESGSSSIVSGAITSNSGMDEFTLTPESGQLVPAKIYRATLATSITDIQGNGLATSGLWNFRTRSGMSLISVQPTSGTSGVSPESTIAATFSQPVASGTITTSAFTVRSGAVSTVNLSGVTFVDTDDPTTAYLVPYSGIVKVSGTYFVRVGTSITDIEGVPLNQSGVWSFTTQAGPPPPDTTPPRVSGTTPVSGASGVSITTNITVNFSEQVQSGTVNTTNLFVRLSGQSALPATVSLAADLKTATINPTSDLAFGTVYHTNVLSGVKDLSDNFLSPYLSGKQFTTVPLTQLVVSGTSPTSGQEGVSTNTNVIITMSQPVQSGTVTTSNIFLRQSGNNTPFNIDVLTLGADLKTITVIPELGWQEGTIYFINVTSGVKSTSGSFLSPNISGQPFRTDLQDASIIYTVADDGNGATLDNDKFRVSFRVRGGTYSPAIAGRSIVAYRAYMKRGGSPLSGVVSGLQLYVEKAAGGKIPFEYGFKRHVNPALVPTTITAFDFYNVSNNYALVQNDKIVIQWISGTSSNTIRVAQVNTNVVNSVAYNEYQGATYSGASYNEYSGKDLAGIMWAEGE